MNGECISQLKDTSSYKRLLLFLIVSCGVKNGAYRFRWSVEIMMWGISSHRIRSADPELVQRSSDEQFLDSIGEVDVKCADNKIKHMCNKRDSILESLERKTVQITALNVDIVNSTERVKTLPDEATGEYYKTFLENASDLIEFYGGYVLKNVGDCVIGFFPCSKYYIENHDKAVLCGLAMSHMLDSLTPYLVQKNIPEIKCRISADFGAAKVIRIGSPDGYSMIDLFGKAINSAAKISRYAKPGQMVVGDDLLRQLIHDDVFEFKLINRWSLTGKYPYSAYTVWLK